MWRRLHTLRRVSSRRYFSNFDGPTPGRTTLSGLKSGIETPQRDADKLYRKPEGVPRMPVATIEQAKLAKEAEFQQRKKLTPESLPIVFDRSIVKQHRNAALETAEQAHDFGYLRRTVAQQLVALIEFVKRDFPMVVDMSYGGGEVSDELSKLAAEKKMKTLVQIDTAENAFYDIDPEMAARHEAAFEEVIQVVGDEEFLTLKPESCDLIVSCLTMHWVNKLPTVMKSIQNALKPDGCFIIAMLGGESLQELRSAFALADLERHGGVMPHISPYAKQSDLGDVLNAGGFSLISCDNDIIRGRYPDMFTLMDHLKQMGESNAIHQRTKTGFFSSRDSMLAAAAAFEALYKDEEDLMECSFHVLYAIGWKPSPDQPQPLERGSASKSFFELEEEPAPPKEVSGNAYAEAHAIEEPEAPESDAKK